MERTKGCCSGERAGENSQHANGEGNQRVLLGGAGENSQRANGEGNQHACTRTCSGERRCSKIIARWRAEVSITSPSRRATLR